MIKKLNDFSIFKQYKAIDRMVKTRFGHVLTKIALEHYLEGFELGGHRTDASQGGWQKRRKSFEMKKRGKKGSSPRSVKFDRALLVKSGDLRNSIRVLSTKLSRMEIGTRGIKYAQIHNEGLMGKAFGKHSFKMPKREFLGRSKPLERVLHKRIEKEITKIFK